jgi:hypothetical protein
LLKLRETLTAETKRANDNAVEYDRLRNAFDAAIAAIRIGMRSRSDQEAKP